MAASSATRTPSIRLRLERWSRMSQTRKAEASSYPSESSAIRTLRHSARRGAERRAAPASLTELSGRLDAQPPDAFLIVTRAWADAELPAASQALTRRR